MAREPDQLRRGEPGHRLDADDIGERTMALPQFGRLAMGARRRYGGWPASAACRRGREHRAVHLAGEADRAGRGEGLGRGAPELAERRRTSPRPRLRDPAPTTKAADGRGDTRASPRRSAAPSASDQHRLEAGRAAIDAERDHRATVAEIGAPRQAPCDAAPGLRVARDSLIAPAAVRGRRKSPRRAACPQPRRRLRSARRARPLARM